MMELYPKAVDFNESWDTLRESTRLMISGEGYLSKDEWNDRIMYPLLFDSWRKTVIKCFKSLAKKRFCCLLGCYQLLRACLLSNYQLNYQ